MQPKLQNAKNANTDALKKYTEVQAESEGLDLLLQKEAAHLEKCTGEKKQMHDELADLRKALATESSDREHIATLQPSSTSCSTTRRMMPFVDAGTIARNPLSFSSIKIPLCIHRIMPLTIPELRCNVKGRTKTRFCYSRICAL